MRLSQSVWVTCCHNLGWSLEMRRLQAVCNTVFCLVRLCNGKSSVMNNCMLNYKKKKELRSGNKPNSHLEWLRKPMTFLSQGRKCSGRDSNKYLQNTSLLNAKVMQYKSGVSSRVQQPRTLGVLMGVFQSDSRPKRYRGENSVAKILKLLSINHNK